jgi:hypothetical protein
LSELYRSSPENLWDGRLNVLKEVLRRFNEALHELVSLAHLYRPVIRDDWSMKGVMEDLAMTSPFISIGHEREVEVETVAYSYVYQDDRRRTPAVHGS